MILATMKSSVSVLKTRAVTRTFAPVSLPTFAALSGVTVPDKPSSCSPKTFSSSARSTMMRFGSPDKLALTSVATFAPRSRTFSSLESKSKTAMGKSWANSARAATLAMNISVRTEMNFSFIILFGSWLREQIGQSQRLRMQRQLAEKDQVELRLRIVGQIRHQVRLDDDHDIGVF